MKKIILASVCLFFAASFLTAEGAVDFSGTVNTLWGAAAPWTDESSAGHFTLGSTGITGKLDAYFGNSSALAEGSLSYDSLSGKLECAMKELWADYTDSFWGIRVGRQKTSWGKADGIDITNVICPSDMKSLSALTGDDSKFPVDAVSFSVNGNSFTLDAWWIPFFTPASLPLEEDNSLRKYIVPETVDLPVSALNTTFSLPVSVSSFTAPETALWNGEYAFKASGYFSALDVSFYAFYGWDDIPLFNYTVIYEGMLPAGLTVSGEYKRFSMFGLDAALPLGETVVRAETAFFPKRHFQKSAEAILKADDSEETSLQRNELSALAGIDWMPEGWTLTAQYWCDMVFGELDNLERKNAFEHGATLSVSKALLGETLKLGFAGVIGLNDFDSFMEPSVEYAVSDYLSLGALAYIFLPGPENNGTYGKYKDLSSFALSAKFSF